MSPLGDGSSLAMAGAHTLAEALAAQPDDDAGARRRYEARHRVLVAPKQRRVGRTAGLLVPKTRFGIRVRDLAARVLR